jgi:hypothetical protein
MMFDENSTSPSNKKTSKRAGRPPGSKSKHRSTELFRHITDHSKPASDEDGIAKEVVETKEKTDKLLELLRKHHAHGLGIYEIEIWKGI